MAITNGYASLTEFKAYFSALGITSTAAGDDAVIEDIVETSSRLIDKITGRTFYARTETHYYDTPCDYSLYIDDDDLLTITTLTNGDGNTITSTKYNLMPLNASLKYCVELKWSSGVYWQTTSAGETRGAISVAGTWGYSSTVPDDIKTACLIMAVNTYRARTGEGTEMKAVVTGAGVLSTPATIPVMAYEIVRGYIRP